MSAEEADSGRIRAIDRVCDILDLVAAEGPIALADIALACGIPKTSAFRYLATLEARQYVNRVGDSAEYRLGLAMMSFQSNPFDPLVEAAIPLLETIRDKFGETANLGVLTGNRISYLAIVESKKSVRLAARAEDKDFVHCTALGKAIVSRMPLGEVHTLLGETFERRTYKTLTTWDGLERELELVRQNGFAVDDEENELGGRCVAVAVAGPFKAAISLSAPVSRLAEKELAKAASELNIISAALTQAIS
jgi:IclR family acetate operon transcriptional repressor